MSTIPSCEDALFAQLAPNPTSFDATKGLRRACLPAAKLARVPRLTPRVRRAAHSFLEGVLGGRNGEMRSASHRRGFPASVGLPTLKQPHNQQKRSATFWERPMDRVRQVQHIPPKLQDQEPLLAPHRLPLRKRVGATGGGVEGVPKPTPQLVQALHGDADVKHDVERPEPARHGAHFRHAFVLALVVPQPEDLRRDVRSPVHHFQRMVPQHAKSLELHELSGAVLRSSEGSIETFEQ
eukprot:scaffold48_cov311-Pinguiococcus_pyrenoidosus.AAC.326